MVISTDEINGFVLFGTSAGHLPATKALWVQRQIRHLKSHEGAICFDMD